MGNQQQEGEQFRQQDWQLINTGVNQVSLWQNRRDPQLHIEQHHIQTHEADQVNKVKDYYVLRKNHPRWVAALFLKEDHNQQFCNNRYGAQLFLQKIPIRLCDLQSVPFPDILHLYDQGLHGYNQFARKQGCFEVERQYMGINEKGVMKVWAGQNWADVGVVGGKLSQQDMVKSIIQCIEACVDYTTMPKQNPSIRNFIYRTSDKVNFEKALDQFKSYVRLTNRGQVPTKLYSLEVNGEIYQNKNLNAISRQYIPGYLQQTRPHETMGSIPYSSQSYIPMNYPSPRFQSNRAPIGQQGITTFRRVQSFANQPVYRQTALSQFAPNQYKQQRRTYEQPVYRSNNVVTFGRSASHSQIGYIQQPLIQNSNIPIFPISSQPIPINYNSPNQIYYQNPPLIQQNQFISRPVSQLYVNGNRNQQIQYQPIQQIQPVQQVRLQQIQTQRNPRISHTIYQPPILGSNFRNEEIFRSSQLNSQPRATTDNKSIIMQLYTSQDNRTLNPSVPVVSTKQFGYVKRSQSLQDDPNRRFDSATLINEDQPTSIVGIPSNQIDNRFKTPSVGNKKSILQLNSGSRLKSIEEVHTQNYYKSDYDQKFNSQDISSYSPSGSYGVNTNGFKQSKKSYDIQGLVKNSYNGYQKYLQQNSSTRTKQNYGSIAVATKPSYGETKYSTISDDDGKSSEQFLKKLKQITSNSTFKKSNYQSNNYDYNSYNDNKKSVGFTDNNDFIFSLNGQKTLQSKFNASDSNQNYNYISKAKNQLSPQFQFGKLAQSKNGSSLSQDYSIQQMNNSSQNIYSTKYSPMLEKQPSYKFDFDPQLLADLQKYKS